MGTKWKNPNLKAAIKEHIQYTYKKLRKFAYKPVKIISLEEQKPKDCF